VEQIALLCQFGAIAPLCTLLEATPKIILVVLDGLANILAAAERMGELEKVSLHVEECVDAWIASKLCRATIMLKSITIHKSLAILEQYFSTYVNNSFLLFLLGFISMITTTVHIQSVCADNFTMY
jgi:importin subunit alpha-2